MRVILRGGPRDGVILELPDDQDSVRIPVAAQAKVLTPEEFEDPANWEVDPLDGRLRLKRPPIGIVEYHRTIAVFNGCTVFA